MRWEYAIFDALIALPPLMLGRRLSAWSEAPRRAALRATLLAALPFVLWDLAVVGRHWQFNPAFVLGPSVGGLPLEEWGLDAEAPFRATELLSGQRLEWLGPRAFVTLTPEESPAQVFRIERRRSASERDFDYFA